MLPISWSGKIVLGLTVLSALGLAQQLSPPAQLSSIEGVTFGPNRQPVSGALLMLSHVKSPAPGTSWYRATSDNFGRFSFKDLTPGQYQVAAFSSGYNPSPSVLTLSAGQHITGLDIELAPLAVLSGKVTDEEGNPMPGVAVNALAPEFVVNGRLRVAKLPNGAQTDASGKYRLELPMASYYLGFSLITKGSVSGNSRWRPALMR